MPSQFDTTYQSWLSDPKYDTVEDQIRQQKIREAEYIFEEAVPPLPSRETELEYMDWLAKDIRSDPILSNRKVKYMAGPKRVPWKNLREQREKVNGEWWSNFAFAAFLSWPLAMWIGGKFRQNTTGVNVYAKPNHCHLHPDVSFGGQTKRVFLRWSGLTILGCGFVYAQLMTDRSRL